MATDIVIEDVTNGSVVNNEWVGTGVFDKLMDAVNKNIAIQYDTGRIKGPQYAEVYLGALQSVLAQSVQYVTQEKLTEAQIDLTRSQDKLAYAERVKVDKECAKLGLDDVIKTQNNTGELIYTPKYEEA